MIDSSTNKPLRVRNEGGHGAYIMVPVSQLEDLRRILDAHSIPYWVEETAISLDGEPEIAFIDLSHRVDDQAVQQLLDGEA